MNELENKQFALFPDSVGETQEEKQKFSFRLGQYILNKKSTGGKKWSSYCSDGIPRGEEKKP